MADPSSNVPDFVLVVCKRCGTRMHPTVRETSYEVKCHDCFTPARVPPRSEVAATLTPPEPPEVGTYRLVLPPDMEQDRDSRSWSGNAPATSSSDHSSEPRPTLRPDWADEDDAEPDTPPPPAKKRRPAAAEVPAGAFTVCCPGCHASFAPTLTDEPQVVLCPECLEDVPVPARSLIRQTVPAPSIDDTDDGFDPPTPLPKPRRESSPEPIEIEDTAARPKPKKKKKKKPPRERNPSVRNEGVNVYDRLAEIRREEEDPPPKWTFFTNTLHFPWRSDVVLRWIFLTAGCTVVSLLSALISHLYATQGQIGVTAIAFFAIPAFWLMLWTLSYAASCGLLIIVETASGNDRIRAWPEPNWREWAGSFFYVFFQLIVTAVLAYFLGQVLGLLFGQPRLWVVLWTFALFPVVLLSSLEANHPLTPLTPAILKSFLYYPDGWVTFYFVSTTVALVAGTLPALLADEHPFLAALVAGPAEAAFFLIYPRLLGRLAWRASTLVPPEESEDEP